jgi:hypothetical protein
MDFGISNWVTCFLNFPIIFCQNEGFDHLSGLVASGVGTGVNQ